MGRPWSGGGDVGGQWSGMETGVGPTSGGYCRRELELLCHKLQVFIVVPTLSVGLPFKRGVREEGCASSSQLKLVKA